jgi:predicted lipid-binding transport protein (Tim44 family)
MRAAESLDAMVLLAVRGFDRIEQLEQQLAASAAGSGEPAQRPAPGTHSARSSATPADMPSAPVIIGGVDVAPLALAARILRMVANEMDEGASELRASVQAARKIVWEVFTDLEAASVRGAS